MMRAGGESEFGYDGVPGSERLAGLPDVLWRHRQREQRGSVGWNGHVVEKLIFVSVPGGGNEAVGRIERRFDVGEARGELRREGKVFVAGAGFVELNSGGAGVKPCAD